MAHHRVDAADDRPDRSDAAKIHARREAARREALPDEIHSWPHLIRLEVLVALVVTAGVLLLASLIDAPLGAPADPRRPPDPPKAPWYLVGLQELLVHFDPWIVGLVLPGLIVFGLVAIPYLDVNPEGNGFYVLRGRRFAIGTFLFGLSLWLIPILIGTFFRGPGWRWGWPGERGGAGRGATAGWDWPALFGVPADTTLGMIIGGGTVLAFLVLPPVVFHQARREHSPTLQELGRLRYGIVALLFMSQLGVALKILLSIVFDLRYVLLGPMGLNI